ncbi:hypothetical protein O6P43_020241 [Quillaja saponaria]|uniref:Uncharacterized protein n=1 Tax=Quillaja saponaria TaxID=32244 RepID=A0AAD7PM03_QUISA|nr:hypothetical protein O6P43_020241 [Quillaja saponaria]
MFKGDIFEVKFEANEDFLRTGHHSQRKEAPQSLKLSKKAIRQRGLVLGHQKASTMVPTVMTSFEIQCCGTEK